MARAGTDRLKVNPPLGRMPALQNLLPSELEIDPAYQRSLEAAPSQTLVRKIAQHWNWDLCQPLVVARRENGALFVIDGQHRLAAARLRGDIQQLPAVVVQYANREDEAASFVHLNMQRRPLSKLDLFKAAIASGDTEATAIAEAMSEVGLSVAPHSNYTCWQPGMISNIGGIEQAWRRYGRTITCTALAILAESFRGQRLRLAGTVFPGIVAVCAANSTAAPGAITTMVKSRTQIEWRTAAMHARAEDPNLKHGDAVAKVFLAAWARSPYAVAFGRLAPPPPPPPPAPPPAERASPPPAPNVALKAPSPPHPNPRPGSLERIAEPVDGKRWCSQCEMRKSVSAATLCASRFCKIRPAFGK